MPGASWRMLVFPLRIRSDGGFPLAIRSDAGEIPDCFTAHTPGRRFADVLQTAVFMPYQRFSAVSSASFAATQLAPSAVTSFFQNGARDLR